MPQGLRQRTPGPASVPVRRGRRADPGLQTGSSPVPGGAERGHAVAWVQRSPALRTVGSAIVSARKDRRGPRGGLQPGFHRALLPVIYRMKT